MKKRVIGMAVVGLAGLVGSSALATAPSPYPRPGHTAIVTTGWDGKPATYQPLQGCESVLSTNASVNATGRFVTFLAAATNLVSRPTVPGQCDVYWRDLQAGVTKQVNVDVAGLPAAEIAADEAGPTSEAPTISADGRYVAFYSLAHNLVPGDTNNAGDIFVRDMQSGVTTRASVSSAGVQGNGGSGIPTISANGRYVAFSSFASNLVAGDTNGVADVFVRDLRTHRTTRVSVSSTRAQADRKSVSGVTVSATGRFVAFGSYATNLVTDGGTTSELCNCTAPDVYWHDMVTGKTRLVSVASNGSRASFDGLPSCTIGTPALLTAPVVGRFPPDLTLELCGSVVDWRGGQHISDDGRFVAFRSNATNLVPSDSNAGAPGGTLGWDVFVHDTTTGRTERVSVNSYGQQVALGAWDGGSLSSDGRFVTFNPLQTVEPCATQVPVTGLPLGLSACSYRDGSVYDRTAGTADRLGMSWQGGQATRGSCKATDALVNSAVGGPATHPDVEALAMSADGRYVAMSSNATDLVPGDTNNRCDYFVRDRGPAVGVGGLTGTPSQSSPQPGCGLPVCPPLPVGAALYQTRVIPRPGLHDLYIRWDVQQMTTVAGAAVGGLLYELRFTSHGQRYSVRAQRVGGADFDPAGGASFGLFRETTPGVWTRLAALKGGYGTVGDSVVTAVPLSLLGGEPQLTDVTASTAVGSYLSGPTKVLDSLRLSR